VAQFPCSTLVGMQLPYKLLRHLFVQVLLYSDTLLYQVYLGSIKSALTVNAETSQVERHSLYHFVASRLGTLCDGIHWKSSGCTAELSNTCGLAAERATRPFFTLLFPLAQRVSTIQKSLDTISRARVQSRTGPKRRATCAPRVFDTIAVIEQPRLAIHAASSQVQAARKRKKYRCGTGHH
jgi:hypothetical protein